jgi:hypothetical protein
MRVKLVVPFLIALALVGAAGLSSLKSGDYCEYDAPIPAFASVSTDLGATPPGLRCVYVHANGRVTYRSTGSWPWFAIALVGFAAVALWTFLRRGSRAARLATAASIAMATVGAFALDGGGGAGFVVGCLFGVPLAWLSDIVFARADGGRRDRTHSVSVGFLSGVAVFVAAVLSTALAPVAAAAIAVALASLCARVLTPRSATTAAPARPAP